MKLTYSDIQRGTIVVSRTDLDTIKEVDIYNTSARTYRMKMRHVTELKYGIIGLSAFLIWMLSDMVFQENLFSGTMILLFAVVVVYGVMKNYIVIPIATLILLLLDWVFVMLVIANLVMTWLLEYIERPLRIEKGYPHFKEISIYFE